ncbi:rev7p [Saccharomyces arboricola H-6]|uniref:Rev7p n=1 Tax=Saccharomyces arboricola (strain H-6 / AS 2.3317 / CBS 10644) TaxID=1160507 RepID=J8Q3Y6_SACAR|nr:rev7p [Saccharomyces arboricola H-6]
MNKWVEKWLKVYLKCYINLVLFYRNVYPPQSFDFTTYQSFNLPQYAPINRHPALIDYIEELILDILSKLTHTYRFCIGIINKHNDLCIEKYVLDFGEFQHVDEDDQIITETEVFDEFRSSLNSLILHLEKLPKINDDSITFEIAINVVELELGHKLDRTRKVDNLEEKLEIERDSNWIKCQEDANLPGGNAFQSPKIKLSSLVGCDVGPLIIHQFSEKLICSGNDEILDGVYSQYEEDESIFGSLL